MTDMQGPKHCKQLYDCKLLAIPEVIDKVSGADWIFPKTSPFLLIWQPSCMHDLLIYAVLFLLKNNIAAINIHYYSAYD